MSFYQTTFLMKRGLLLILLLLFLTHKTKAQDIKITWGNPLASRHSSYKLLREDNKGNFILVKRDYSGKGKWYIEKYTSRNHSKIFSQQINLSLKRGSKKKKYRLEYEDAYAMDNSILILAVKYERKLTAYKVYLKVFTLEGLEKSQWVKVENITAPAFYGKIDYKISFSNDKSKLLIQRNSNNKFVYSIYNSDLDKRFLKEVTISKKEDVEDDEYSFSGKVSNNGTVYFFSRLKEDVTLYKLEEDRSIVNTSELTGYEVKLKGKEIVDFTNFINEKDSTIVISCFYVEDKDKESVEERKILRGIGGVKSSRISGLAYIKLDDHSLREKSRAINSLDNNFLSKYHSDTRRRRAGKILSSPIEIRNLIHKDSGGVVLIAEKTFLEQHCRMEEGCSYSHHFEQLIVIGIDVNGKVKYTSNINKYNYTNLSSTSGGDLSYSFLPTSKGIFFFYRGNYMDFDGSIREVRQNHPYKKAVLVKTFVSNIGETSSEAVIRFKDLKLYHINPRFTITKKNNRGVVMIGQFKKMIKFSDFEVD